MRTRIKRAALCSSFRYNDSIQLYRDYIKETNPAEYQIIELNYKIKQIKRELAAYNTTYSRRALCAASIAKKVVKPFQNIEKPDMVFIKVFDDLLEVSEADARRLGLTIIRK